MQLSGGSTSALEKLMYRYEAKVYQFALKLVKSPELSEEIAQDTFIKIWEKREELVNIDSLAAWLFSVTKNKAFNHLKQITARDIREGIYAGEAIGSLNGEAEIHYRELKRLVASMVDQLPSQRRLIYKMKMEQGLNNDDIGSRLNLSPNTVKNQLNKSLQTLKELLSGHLSLFLVMVILQYK